MTATTMTATAETVMIVTIVTVVGEAFEEGDNAKRVEEDEDKVEAEEAGRPDAANTQFTPTTVRQSRHQELPLSKRMKRQPLILDLTLHPTIEHQLQQGKPLIDKSTCRNPKMPDNKKIQGL